MLVGNLRASAIDAHADGLVDDSHVHGHVDTGYLRKRIDSRERQVAAHVRHARLIEEVRRDLSGESAGQEARLTRQILERDRLPLDVARQQPADVRLRRPALADAAEPVVHIRTPVRRDVPIQSQHEGVAVER